MFEIGEIVTRKSHGDDIVFKVTGISTNNSGEKQYELKGLHMRLLADAPESDLIKVTAEFLKDEIVRLEGTFNDSMRRVLQRRGYQREQSEMARGEPAKKFQFFDWPGKVLHIDGDEDYMKMCLKTYGQLHIEAIGEWIEESKQPERVAELVRKYQPDILILTGHDSLVSLGKKEKDKERDFRDMNNYRNSQYFVDSVHNARSVRPSVDDLVIFAGACQSYFEAILAAGANFASSPTRIFIHAYDPVFIAEKVAFTPINRVVDISDAITASVTGADGVGGLETHGKFRLGMPKSPY
ncbi:MAG: sporulation peptidase YabG [Anaerosporomusa subterranea]|jgi:spore coat assembly protein|nr:sporulation peptidase YabG [Anaerosporomusa subterranea]